MTPGYIKAKARELAGRHRICGTQSGTACDCGWIERAAAIEAWGIKVDEDAQKAIISILATAEPVLIADHWGDPRWVFEGTPEMKRLMTKVKP